MSTFAIGSLVAAALVVVRAATVNGRLMAFFAAAISSLYAMATIAFWPLVSTTPFAAPFLLLHVITWLHLLFLSWPTMRSLPVRVLVSIPGFFFLAAAILSLPWGIAFRLGFHPWGAYVPFALAAVGVVQSLLTRHTDVHLAMDDADVPDLARHAARGPRVERPLRIVQISDPHLGSFMSVDRLYRICERAVAADPDLILLTGDFMTVESQRSATHLTEALAPLRALAGRTFACLGNHDHEVTDLVTEALRANKVCLLVDQAATVDTPWGTVELVGFDFVMRGRAAHLARVAALHPRRHGLRRIAMLHDPGAFRHLPNGTADLVLSGHTHGGQLGLVSLGLTWTVVSLTRIPDHGLWAKGRDRLYVHRGNGHYGFPLRIGVPGKKAFCTSIGHGADPASGRSCRSIWRYSESLGSARKPKR